MGMKKQQQIACLSLILLIILIFKTPTFAVGYGRFNKLRTGLSSNYEINHGKQHKHSTKGNAEENGDYFFGANMRKIHTGPNPLHNR
ncbi:unnamed protein product [Amaranthus hypochondriacus]